MQECPLCGAEIKSIPAGVSKKSGKPYNAFKVCSNRECGYKPVEENGVVNKVVNSVLKDPKKEFEKDEFVVGKEKNTTLMCRKDLMVALVNKWLDPVDTKVICETFDTLWTKIEG